MTNTARQSEWGKTLTVWLVTLAFGLGLFEIALRLAPGLISLPFLAKFDSGLRADIAAATGLPTARQYRIFKSEDRTDKGRDLALFEPNATYLWPADTADREAGALEVQTSDAYGFCNPAGDDPPGYFRVHRALSRRSGRNSPSAQLRTHTSSMAS